MASAEILGRSIEYERLHPERDGDGRPVLVFLHEGLGSLSAWRDFPARVAAATGCSALVYSREGYGQSSRLTAPRDPHYLHREALQVLPAVLAHFDIQAPLLIGHSDGGSIALIHAGGAARSPAGVIVLAPHVFVEDLSLRGIRAARDAFLSTDLCAKLARHHADPTSMFWGWNDIWLSPGFAAWNIEEFLPRVRCRIVAIQGEGDEYGTQAQIESIARRSPSGVQTLILKDCGHSPQRDQPLAVIHSISAVVASLLSPGTG